MRQSHNSPSAVGHEWFDKVILLSLCIHVYSGCVKDNLSTFGEVDNPMIDSRMCRALSLSILGFFVTLTAYAQPCSCTECPIQTVDLVPGTIPVEVEGLTNDDLSDPGQGICGVRMQFVHGDIGDMTIDLVSPSGTLVQLVGPFSLCGFTGGNTWDVLFLPCGETPAPDPGMPPVWSNCDFENTFDIDYTGSYHPAGGCLEDFNTGSANGTWELNFLDNLPGSFGNITGFEIIFCDPSGALDCETPICESVNAELPTDIFVCPGDETIILEGNDPSVFDHEWSTIDGNIISGQGTEVISIEGSGTYTVVIEGPDPESGLLCSDTASVFVRPTAFPIPELIFDEPYELNCNQSQVLIAPTVNNSSGADEYIWETTNGNIIGATDGPSILVDATGTYRVRVQNPEDCGNTYEVNVVENFELPEFRIGSHNDLNCIFLFADLNLIDIDPGDSISWAGPGILPGNENRQNQTVTIPGLYEIVVTGENGCVYTDAVTVTIDTIPPEMEIRQDAPLTCLDLEVLLSVASDIPVTDHIWSGAGVDDDQRFNAAILVTSPGVYTVSAASVINGCRSETTYIVLDETMPPTLSSYEDTLNCLNRQIVLDVQGMGDTLRYQWGGPAITAENENEPNPVVDQAGLYEVILTTDGNCPVLGFVFLRLDTLPPDIEILTDSFDCDDLSITIGVEPGEDGLSYLWTGPGIDTEIDNEPTITSSEAGLYELIVAEDNGCTDTIRYDIEESADIPSIDLRADTISCSHPRALIASTSNATVTYMWEGPGIDASNVNSPSPEVDAPGIYTVTIMDSLGCGNSTMIEVVADTVSPSIHFGDSLISCTASSLVLTGTIDNAVDIIWSGPAIAAGQERALNPEIEGPGTFSVIATNSNGCESRAAVEVGLRDDAPALSLRADTLTCLRTQVSLESSTTASVVYEWEGPDIDVNNSSEATPDIAIPGTYELTITTVQDCKTIERIEVFQDTLAPDLILPTDTLSCDSILINLSPISSRAISYSWSGPSITAGQQSVVSPSIDLAGDYALTVTAANGCTTEEVISIYADTAAPVILLMADTIDCIEESIRLENSSIAREYVWTGAGITDESINLQSPSVSIPGPYWVEVTGDNGCTSSASVTVQADTISPVGSVEAEIITCARSEVVLDLRTDAADQLWAGPSITVVNENFIHPEVDLAGLYTVMLIGENGCTTELELEVQIDTLAPIAQITTDGFVITCEQPDIALLGDRSSGIGSLIYDWERVDGPVPEGLVDSVYSTTGRPGVYVLTVTDEQNGCMDTDSIGIEIDADFPRLQVDPYEIITCARPVISLDGSGSESGEEVVYFWEGPGIVTLDSAAIIDVDQSGEYNLIVYNAATGCRADTTIIVDDDLRRPEISTSVSAIITCAEPEVILSSEGSDNGSAYGFLWEGPGITATIENSYNPVVSIPGDYTLVITDFRNGCTSQRIQRVEEIDNRPTELLISLRDPSCDDGSDGVISIDGIQGGVLPIEYFLNDIPLADTRIANLLPGEYIVSILDANGCSLTDTLTLQKLEKLQLDVGEDQDLELGDDADIRALINKDSSDITEILWDGPYIDCSSCLDQFFLPQRSGIYSLLLTDKDGCTAYDELYINVAIGNTAFIPNVFSPNGDAENDRFRPFMSDKVRHIDAIEVYDRGGNRVYQATMLDPSVDQIGWDGSYQGQPLDPGVFTYIMQYTLINGLQIQTSGDVTLIK